MIQFIPNQHLGQASFYVQLLQLLYHFVDRRLPNVFIPNLITLVRHRNAMQYQRLLRHLFFFTVFAQVGRNVRCFHTLSTKNEETFVNVVSKWKGISPTGFLTKFAKIIC